LTGVRSDAIVMDVAHASTGLNPGAEMRISKPKEVRISNQRYRSLSAIAGAALLLSFPVAAFMPLLDRRFDRFTKYALPAVGLLMLLYCLYAYLFIIDLRRGQRPSRWVIALAVWRWVVLGIRDHELGPSPGETIAVALFGWLLPRKHWAQFLKLGQGLKIDCDVLIPIGDVRQVQFAPDPDEDYVEPDPADRYCAAAVVLETGREFRLVVNHADAEQLRHWARTNDIEISDCAGYRPRAFEPRSETLIDERQPRTA
jgi:hypothetical protein